MPWVEFWASTNCGSGISPKEKTYEWYGKIPSDESLKDDAKEFVPSWMNGLERGYKYGFDVLEKLPENIKLTLIKQYESQKRYAEAMIEILTKE